LGALLAVLVLFVVPLGLRLGPIAHGAPYSYVPDTHLVRNALGMAKDKDLVPPVRKYSTYPYLLPYVLLPVYAGQYAVGRASGEWNSADEYKNRILEEPIRAHLAARITLAILSALVAFGAFGAARAAGLANGAWFAAWFAGTSLLHVHLSVQERPWAPFATALVFTAWPAIVHARTGAPRALLLAGVAAGIAFAILPAGLAALGLTGLAWAVAPTPGPSGARPAAWRGRALRQRLRLGFRTVAVALLIAVPLGHPYWIKYGPTKADQVVANDVVLEGEQTFTLGGLRLPIGFRPETFFEQGPALFGYDPAVILLLLLGLVPALRRRALWPPLYLMLGWAALFLTTPNGHVRYLAPVVLLGALPAGLAAERLGRSGLGRVFVIALCAVPLVQAVRFDYVMRQPDTRALALPKLAELGPRERVAIDVYGPTPPRDARALETTAELRDLYSREAHRAAYYDAGLAPPGPAGLDTLGLEDVFEYDLAHGGTWIRPAAEGFGASTAEVLRGLGVDYLLLVDRTPADGRRPPLVDPTPSIPSARFGPDSAPVPKLAPLALEGEPVWTIDPARSGSTARDGQLPTEMRFPLRDLWTIARPGPRLELWRLEDSHDD